MYLSELKKCKGNEEKIKELEEKFVIPAVIRNPIDFEITYSNYILHKVPTIDFVTGDKLEGTSIVDVMNRYEGLYIKYSNGKELKGIQKEEFIGYARRALIANENVNLNIVEQYSEDDGFRNYIAKNIPDVVENLEQQEIMIAKIKGVILEGDLECGIWDKIDKMHLVGKRDVLYTNLINRVRQVKEKIASGKMGEQELTKIANFVENSKVLEFQLLASFLPKKSQG